MSKRRIGYIGSMSVAVVPDEGHFERDCPQEITESVGEKLIAQDPDSWQWAETPPSRSPAKTKGRRS